MRLIGTIALSVALFAALTACPAIASAQHEIGSGTIDFNAYTGGGFASTPGAGQLDSDTWKAKGASDGSFEFGGTADSGDFARGESNGGVTTGGLYAFDTTGVDDRCFGWQATAADFCGNAAGGAAGTEGEFVLKLVNNTGNTITTLKIDYEIKYNNNGDNTRVNAVEFAHSAADSSYTTESALSFSTPGEPDVPALGWQTEAKTITITGLNIADGGNYYLRWKTFDESGAGTRDEMGIDDISVTAPVTIDFESASLNDNTAKPDAIYHLMAKFTCTGSGGATTLATIIVDAGTTDTADSNTDVATVRLFQDDGDGSFNYAIDSEIDTATFAADQATLTVNQAFSAGTAVTYFLVYDFSGSGTAGETISATIDATVTGGTDEGTPLDTRTVQLSNGSSVGTGGGGCDASLTGSASPIAWILSLLLLVLIRRRVIA